MKYSQQIIPLLLILILLTCLVNLMTCTVQQNQPTTPPFKVLLPPIKGEYDTNQYRTIELANGMTVMAIHNDAFNKSGACINIKVGKFDDKLYGKGMSTFVANNLLLNHDNDEDPYDLYSYVTERNGHMNVSVDEEHTEIDFRISTSGFEEMFKKLANCFLESPIKNSDFESMESWLRWKRFGMKMRLVDEERPEKDDKNTPMHWIRRVASQVCKSSHPYYNHLCHVTDNEICSNPKFVEQFEKLWGEKYTARNMRLVLYGNIGLDRLIEYAVKYYGPIERGIEVEDPKYGFPFDENVAARMATTIVCQLQENHVVVWWQIPSSLVSRATKPEQYLANMIKYKGEGSIMEILREKNYATDLDCFCKKFDEFALFTVLIRATEKGIDRVIEMTRTVAAYISLVRSNPISTKYWEEINFCNKIKFNINSNEDKIEYKIMRLARNLHYYPPERTLCGHLLPEFTDLKGIEEFNAAIKMINLHVHVIVKFPTYHRGENISDFIKAYLEEKVGVIEFKYVSIDELVKERVVGVHYDSYPKLKLPQPNGYIPIAYGPRDKKSSKENQQTASGPILLIPNILWFYRDYDTEYPIVSISLLLHFTSIASKNPKHEVLGKLVASCFTTVITTRYYSAILIGYKFSIKFTQEGFRIKISGLKEKIESISRRILKEFFEYVVSEEHFEDVLEELRQSVSKDLVRVSADDEIVNVLDEYLIPNIPNRDVTRRVIGAITYNDIVEFCSLIHSKEFTTVALIFGNITAAEAIILLIWLNLPTIQPFTSYCQTRIIEAKSEKMLYKYHPDRHSAVKLFLQCPCEKGGGVAEAKIRVLANVFLQMFNRIFTYETDNMDESEKGYSSKLELKDFGQSIGIYCAMETEMKNYSAIETTILNLLATSLNEFTTEPFSKIRFEIEAESFKLKLKKDWKSKEFKEEFMVNQIISGRFDFGLVQAQIDITSELTPADLLKFVKDYIMPDGKERRLISIWLIGYNHSKTNLQGRKRLSESEDLPDVSRLNIE